MQYHRQQRKLKIVICGATGNQGGALAVQLLQDPRYEVVCLTRTPGSPNAARLRLAGAEIVRADPAGQQSLLHAFAGAYAVFGITQPWSEEKGVYDTRKEIIQAKNILWACRENGVAHLLYSSFLNPLDKPAGVTFIDSKLVIENLIKGFGIPHTILRCGLYMDNLVIDRYNDVISGNYGGGTEIPYVALEDVGRYAAYVLRHPALFCNKTMNLIGDLIHGDQLAHIASSLSGRLLAIKQSLLSFSF